MGWGVNGTTGNYRATVPTTTHNPMFGVTHKRCSMCGNKHPQSVIKITTPQEVIDAVVEKHVELTYVTDTGIVKHHAPYKVSQLTEKAIKEHVDHTYACLYCLGLKHLPSATDEIDIPKATPSGVGGIAVHDCEQDNIGFCVVCGVWML